MDTSKGAVSRSATELFRNRTARMRTLKMRVGLGGGGATACELLATSSECTPPGCSNVRMTARVARLEATTLHTLTAFLFVSRLRSSPEAAPGSCYVAARNR